MAMIGSARAQTAKSDDLTADAPVAGVRTTTATLAAVVQEATERSATFRRLVTMIGATDGIVYVEEGRCGHSTRACLVAVTAAGPNRILRVVVDARRGEWDLMGSIGYELQHAIEVLGSPKVTSTAAMHLFYLRESHSTGDRFETAAAVRAGQDVRSEVRRDAPVPAAR